VAAQLQASRAVLSSTELVSYLFTTATFMGSLGFADENTEKTGSYFQIIHYENKAPQKAIVLSDGSPYVKC
jgi:hypothetical protein